MLISDAIRQIKTTTHDDTDEFATEHCLDFLNHAIQEVSSLLIAGGYVPMVQQMPVREGTILPNNFMKFAGKYPIKVTGNRCELLDDDEWEIKCRFFATPELVTTKDTYMPFNHDAINVVIVKLATILALNENEYDISTDNAIKAELTQAIASGMGAQ